MTEELNKARKIHNDNVTFEQHKQGFIVYAMWLTHSEVFQMFTQ